MTVLHFNKTRAFNTDSRVLKWIKSLEEQGINSEVYVLEDKNTRDKFRYRTADVITTRLFFRKFFPKHKGYVFKIPEYSWECLRTAVKTRHEFLLFHDTQAYLTILILCLFKGMLLKGHKKIVWDLHELPHESLFRIGVTRKILKFMLEKVDFIVYTNNKRREYMLERLPYRENNYAILNNYPDNDYIRMARHELPEDVKTWLGTSPYMLWLGDADNRKRNFLSALNALVKHKDNLKLVILGGLKPEMKELIESKCGTSFLMNRYVPQDQIIRYVDNALFSIVLYPYISPNNEYCEPNRLYQLITRKISVICGANPPMKEVMEAYHAGIVLGDDGSDEKILQQAVDQMMQNNERAEYINSLNAWDFTRYLSWDTQVEVLINQLKVL